MGSKINAVLIVSVGIQEVLEPCSRTASFKRLVDALYRVIEKDGRDLKPL